MHLLGECSEALGLRWPNFGPLVAKKDPQKYAYNPIQTCGVHLLRVHHKFHSLLDHVGSMLAL